MDVVGITEVVGSGVDVGVYSEVEVEVEVEVVVVLCSNIVVEVVVEVVVGATDEELTVDDSQGQTVLVVLLVIVTVDTPRAWCARRCAWPSRWATALEERAASSVTDLKNRIVARFSLTIGIQIELQMLL